MLFYFTPLFCVHLSVSSFKLTTLPNAFNLTSLEERMTNLEQTIERRLAVTERVIGELLTGQADENLETLDVLALRSGRLSTAFSPVMFSAYKSSRESDISTKVTIRFDGTYINPGNHYHTEDGIFIAPVTGVYMFHWVIVNNKSSFTTQLMVAGTPRASNLIPFPGGRDSSSAMVIISVNKDDHVWIQIYGSSVYVFGGGTSYNNHQSTFTGILLQKA